MTEEYIKKNPSAFLEKSVFCQILRVKNDKIRMSGRSVSSIFKQKG